MFGLAGNRYRDDPTGQITKRPPNPGKDLSEEGSKMETEDIMEMDEEKFERTARLCSIRKRSVEIPLEYLLSGMIFLSGGRDTRDGPVLSIVQPVDADVDLLMELKHDEIVDMLSYFTFVPSEEIRNRKFSVVVAADGMYDFFLKNIIVALNSFQADNNVFHMAYILSNSRNIESTNILQWAHGIELNGHEKTTTEEEESENANGEEAGEEAGGIEFMKEPPPKLVLPYTFKGTPAELFEYIPANQLTQEFGGSVKYNHQDWVRFRMQVEPFICDVVGVSKRLAQAISPFTNEDLPDTLKEAEESVKLHHLQRRKTFENLHVEELASEGEKIRERMHSPSKELLQDNPDFSATLDTVDVLVSRVESVRSRLEKLWYVRNEKLEANLKKKKFEYEAKQIIDWFEQYAEEFFETHTEIGESLEVAQALITELLEFEESTKQILQKTDRLLKNASELDNLKHLGCNVEDVAKKIQGQISDFKAKMKERKELLDDAVKLHNIMEKSLTWCIEGVDFLGSYDIMNMDKNLIDPNDIKEQLETFQSQFPPPSKEEISLLSNAVASMDSQWGTKEGFEFALNRIVELHDRFAFYHKILDDMIKSDSEELPSSSHPSSGGRLHDDDLETEQLVGRTNRRLSVDGKRIQVSVLDVDKRAQQALSLLEKTDHKLSKKTEDGTNKGKGEEEEGGCGEGGGRNSGGSNTNNTDSDCVSLIEFLSEVDRTETPPTLDLLEVTETRSRSYSAPDEATDGEGGGTLKRTRSLSRKNRQRAISPLPPLKPDISGPSNPQFEEEVEHVSLDDVTVEENPEDIEMQTAHAKHRRNLMEELLTTEQQYIKDLEHIIAKYVPHFGHESDLPPSLRGKADIFFGLLPEYLEFSRDTVLPRIRKCVRAPIKMGLVFLDHEEQFLRYAMYFKNKPQQDELIAMEDEFFRHLQEKIGDSLLVNAYMIKPVQRMTKYKQFLEEMVKYSTKGKEVQEVQKGAKKEYFGKLKEALKMVDFVLRHGNDLLALESVKGYSGNLEKLGRILRVGDLILVDGFTKHRRKLFLFENALLFAKTRKTTRVGPTGSEVYDYKMMFKTSELMLREQVPGHENRFALEMTKRKDIICLQAETVEEKQKWVQEIWDLFFSHMLSLRDDNLQSHGTKALSGVMTTGTATLTRGRPLSYSMRKRVHSLAANRGMEIPKSDSRDSLSSIGSATSLKEFAEYVRNKRDSRNFPAHYAANAPISPRSSMAIPIHEKNYRMSTLSTASNASAMSGDTLVSTPRSSTISHSLSNTTISSSGQETASNNSFATSPSLAEVPLDESIKLYSTPL